jgi:hypothetical protein
MSTIRNLLSRLLLLSVFIYTAPLALSQEGTSAPPKVQTVEINLPSAEAEVGKQIKFTATAKDAAGKPVSVTPTAWFAAPFDLAAASEDGTISFYNPGEVMIGAVIAGKFAMIKVNVKPQRVATVVIEPLASPLVVGGTARLKATTRTPKGDPRSGVLVNWTSDTPAVATVDAAGVVLGLAPGKATIRADAEGAKGMVAVEVVKNNVQSLAVEPRTATARTGDVVRFKATARGDGGSANPYVRWNVSGEGAMIEADGAFVAERPGSYVVTATSGERTAVSSVVVSPRNVERNYEIVGRSSHKDVQTAEQWVFNNFVYVSTISDKLLVYDITDPANPKLTDTIKVDARTVNDISITADGRTGVLTREGASSRKNGIVFLDTSDLAHPKVVSEYTETVSGGVHSAYIDGHYVYLTDDSTGSLRIIDFKDVKAPKEVARWQVENPTITTVRAGGTETIGGRYLHDVQVKDGLAYLAYWRDGLIILDVGKGIKGGSPENPKLVSQFRLNYYELYGDGWLAGSHEVFRYKNYVFVGDEVFPPIFDISSKERIPVRGIVHVIDVADIENPRKVAEYSVPEAGSHNIWVENDTLYMGYYNGGGRVLDVSGELRGELYRQGREIARIYTGSAEGFRSNLPFTWGARPYKDMVFFNDINTGIWIVRLTNKPKFQGSTTAPSN